MRTVLIAAVLLTACRDERSAPARRAPACAGCVVKERPLPTTRGDIVDRRGVPLAVNRPAQDVHVIPRTFDAAARDAMIQALALDADEIARVDAAVARARKANPGRAVAALADVTPARAQAARALAGVEVRAGVARDYVSGALAAHVVGYVAALTEPEISRLAATGYQLDDRVGRTGVERAWEQYLRGKPGAQRSLVDPAGAVVEDTDRFEPVPGDNVVLTIDAALQRMAEDAVAPQGAAAVAIVEVASGKIRALVSTPSFDPRVMSAGIRPADLAPPVDDPRRPFIDRTVAESYPPDATYGFVTAIAALEDGVTTADDRRACTGSLEVGRTVFRCDARHGELTIAGALAEGCDAHLWQLAERVGLDRMSEVARAFGLGAPTGLGLGNEDGGTIPTKGWYAQRGDFEIGYTLNAASGAGDVEVTVVQLATAYAALAGGRRHVPQIVERIEQRTGKVVIVYDPKLAPSVTTTPEILDEIRRAMAQAVVDGAAAAARSAVVEIAGQVGTAPVRERGKQGATASHAWFAGWAPADAPEVAIVVLIPHGGDGAKVAAPIARTILEGWWKTVR